MSSRSLYLFSVKTIKISDMGQFPGVVNAHREKKIWLSKWDISGTLVINFMSKTLFSTGFGPLLHSNTVIDYCCVILIDGFSIHSVNMYQTCLIFSGSPVTQLLLHQVFQQGLVQ